MMVLALDQAPRTTGFCYGESKFGTVPVWGVRSFPSYGENEIPLCREVRRWLLTLCEEVQPKVISVEQIIINRNHVNMPVTYQQFAVVAAVIGVVEHLGIDLFQIDIVEWRKRALGKSNKPKWAPDGEDSWLKEAAKFACAQRNWLIEDHNAAEAALMWDFQCAFVDKAYMVASKPDVERVRLEREDKDRAFSGKLS